MPEPVDLTEAIDAAARCMWEAMYPDWPWDDAPPPSAHLTRELVRPHVEAAAPIIAAETLRATAKAYRAEGYRLPTCQWLNDRAEQAGATR